MSFSDIGVPLMNIHFFSVIYVPIVPFFGIHPFVRHLSPRYQTTKLAVGSRNGRTETLRFWQCETLGQRRAECLLHLQPLLQVN